MWRRTIAFSLLAGLWITGCGSSPGSATAAPFSTGPDSSPAPSATSSAMGGANPDDPVSSTPGPDDGSQRRNRWRRVRPRPGMEGVHPIPWHSVRVRDDDRTVIVRFISGVEPCYVLDHVTDEYSRRKVTITLYEGHEPGSEDQACPEIAEYKSTKVVLDERVKGRRIVDGAED